MQKLTHSQEVTFSYLFKSSEKIFKKFTFQQKKEEKMSRWEFSLCKSYLFINITDNIRVSNIK